MKNRAPNRSPCRKRWPHPPEAMAVAELPRRRLRPGGAGARGPPGRQLRGPGPGPGRCCCGQGPWLLLIHLSLEVLLRESACSSTVSATRAVRRWMAWTALSLPGWEIHPVGIGVGVDDGHEGDVDPRASMTATLPCGVNHIDETGAAPYSPRCPGSVELGASSRSSGTSSGEVAEGPSSMTASDSFSRPMERRRWKSWRHASQPVWLT